MSTGRVDSIIIQDAIQREVTFLESNLVRLSGLIKDFPKINSLLGDVNSQKDLVNAQNTIVKTANELNSIQFSVSQSTKQLNALQEAQRGILERLNNSINDNVKVLIRNKEQLAQNVSYQKDLKKQLDSNQISQEEYNKKITNAVKKQLEYKEAISAANKELKASTQIDFAVPNSINAARAQNKQLTSIRDTLDTNDVETIRLLNEQIDRNNDLIDKNSDKLSKQKINIGNYASGFAGARNIIERELALIENKLSKGNLQGKALDEVAQKYNVLSSAVTTLNSNYTTSTAATSAYKEVSTQLGVVFGTNSQVFKEFNSEVGKGTAQLKIVQNEVKSAGEKSNILATGLSKVWSSLRLIANVLPGVGIATLVGFLIEPAIKWVQSLTKVNDQLKALRDLNSEIAQNAGGEIAKLQVLYSVATNVENTQKNRLEAVREIKKEFPDYFQNLSDEAILMGKVGDAYDKTSEKILDQAKLRAVESQLTKLATEELKVVEENNIKNNELIKAQTVLYNQRNKAIEEGFNPKGAAATSGPEQQNLSLLKLQIKSINDEVAKGNGRLVKIAEERQFLLKQINGSKSLLFDDKGAVVESQRKLTELINNDFEIYKLAQERKIKLLLDETDQEKNTYDKRIAFLNQYSTERLNLIDRTEQDERRKAESKLANDIENLNKEKIKKGANVTQINQEIARISANAQQNIRLIVARAQNERLLVYDENEKRFTEIAIQNNKAIEKSFEDTYKRIIELIKAAEKERAAVLSANRGQEELKVLQDYAEGRIKTENEVRRKRQEIEERYNKAAIENELQTQLQIATLNIVYGKSNVETAAKIAELLVKQQELANKKLIDLEKQLFEEKRNLAAKERNLRQQTLDFFKTDIDEYYQGQIDQLTAQAQQVDQNTQDRIDQINQLGLTEEERIKRVTAAEKQGAFEKEQIEKRKADAEKQRKTISKVANIAEVGATSAKEVFQLVALAARAKALAAVLAANPLTAAFAPVARASAAAISAQIPLVIAAAGLNIAKIAAFRKGTNNAPSGPALVSEEGQELMLGLDGSISLTPKKPSLINLKGGEKIIPAFETEQLLKMVNLSHLLNGRGGKLNNSDSDSLSGAMLSELQQIRKKESTRIFIENKAPIETTAWYDKMIKG